MLKSNMRKSKNNQVIHSRRLLSAITSLTLIALLTVSLLHASPTCAQSQTQAASATAPTLEFEVATIKPNKSDIAPAALTTDDGIDMRNIPSGFFWAWHSE